MPRMDQKCCLPGHTRHRSPTVSGSKYNGVHQSELLFMQNTWRTKTWLALITFMKIELIGPGFLRTISTVQSKRCLYGTIPTSIKLLALLTVRAVMVASMLVYGVEVIIRYSIFFN